MENDWEEKESSSDIFFQFGQQSFNFLGADAVLFGLVVEGEESDRAFVHIDKGGVGNDPGSVAFPLPLAEMAMRTLRRLLPRSAPWAGFCSKELISLSKSLSNE